MVSRFSFYRIIRNILGVLFIISLAVLLAVWMQYDRMQSLNKQINERVVSAAVDEQAEEQDLYLPVVDFTALKEINVNCVGWIYACDGEINYPIIASGDDYYLSHLADGTEAKCGSIIVNNDSENPFEEGRNVVYGHNMKDGSMFHPLLQYWQDSNYLTEHPNIYIITENETYIYEITAVYVKEYNEIEFITGTGQETQRLIDLITCEYSGKNTRLVVEAERI